MKSIYWYCLLAIIGIGIAVFTIYKKRHEIRILDLIAFYLFSTCVTWIGEFTVLGLFNSYAYKTGVFSDTWAQNLLGHLILNSSLWPGIALLVAAFSLGYGWILVITCLYVLIEYLFISLGIYEHHWWKYYMTALCVFIYLVITKQWFKKLMKKLFGHMRIVTLYFIGFVILHYPIPIMILLGKQYYNVNWVSNRYLSSTLFIFTYQLIETFILVFFICVLQKWYWKLVPFIVSLAGQSILVLFKILIFMDNWKLLNTMIIYYLCIITLILIEKYTLKSKRRYSY